MDQAGKRFRTFFIENEKRLLRFARRFGSTHKAEDLVQFAFEKFWLKLKANETIENDLAWFYRVIRNRAIDIFRKEGREVPFSILEPELESNDDPEQAALNRCLLKVLDDIKYLEKEIVVLKFQEEFSYKEISEITGQSESNIGVIINRTLKKLKLLLEIQND
jgi:RNA polymerase sigma factor (sigma-70 family)